MSMSSLNSIGQTVFELESGNENVDGQMDGQTNEETELHQFRKEPSYDVDLSPCQVLIRLDKPFSSYSPETKMWMDRQTDKKWTNERTKLHQFQKEPSYDGDLCPCQV